MAWRCGLFRRSPRKFDLRAFLCSCMAIAWQPCPSLRHHAVWLGLSSGLTFSKQALHRRIHLAERFLRECLQSVLAARLPCPAIRGAFTRILLHDSTCVSLSPQLAAQFPGPRNQSGQPQACLRIQCLYDLLSERFVHLRLDPFTRNDQAAADDPLALLQTGDLMVRDLGYFTLASLANIAAAGACFLTRWRFGVSLRDTVHQRPFDLATQLRDGERLERDLIIGQKQPLRVRLVAVPVPESVANERRRKARANRDKRLNHSDSHLRLLGWNIFVTNACAQDLPSSSIPALYRLRWRIEILFKAWKSHLHLCDLAGRGPRHLIVLAFGLLLFVLLTHDQPLPVDAPSAHHQADPPMSVLKRCAFLSQWIPLLLFASMPPHDLIARMHQQLLAHGRYEKRGRQNYLDLRHAALS